jgi:hypothetical protein
MNKKDAIAKMVKGKKMTHRLFEPHEWIAFETFGL